MKTQHKNRFVLPLLVTMIFGLSGCADDKADSKRGRDARVSQSKSKPVARREVRDLFNLKSKMLEYSYNPIGKRDPFKESSGSSQLVQVGGGGPLTVYEIDQMKLVAVIWGISEPRGMVVLPDGKSYIVKRNSPIGRHFGKVARITPTALIVEEEFRGALGDLQIKETKLLLHSEDGQNLKVESVNIP